MIKEKESYKFESHKIDNIKQEIVRLDQNLSSLKIEIKQLWKKNKTHFSTIV